MIDVLTRAADYAVAAHGDQKYGDAPYSLHLSQVAYLVDLAVPNDPEMVEAAWLHDVLEDTPATFNELEKLFGPRVAGLVFAVTGEGKNRKERSASVLRKIQAYGGKPCRGLGKDAAILKLCDRLANVTSCVFHGNKSLLQMYWNEWPAMMKAFEPFDSHWLFVALHDEFVKGGLG